MSAMTPRAGATHLPAVPGPGPDQVKLATLLWAELAPDGWSPVQHPHLWADCMLFAGAVIRAGWRGAA